ncbi:MAG: hypothetical protein HC852_14510 [Acaryochloridaceae cyanobacterium RU_4_10]|nr:hypothetical protein [Acaryochloridaceae cyanobacterium RU_4_10]
MDNFNQSSFNQASLKALERRIDLYDQSKIGLPQLSQDLSSIVSEMIDIPINWHHKFMKYWGVVEEVNALALEKDSCKPLPSDQKILQKALAELRVLIHEEQ